METRGLKSKLHKIIELGTVKFNCICNVVSELEAMADPGKRIAVSASEVHDIKNEMEKGIPELLIMRA